MPNEFGIPNISHTLPGDALAVRSALEKILVQLKSMGFSSDHCSVTELVLAEVMNNIVEHAYSLGDLGPIHVSVQRKEMALFFSITDHGDPMPRYSLPQATLANLDCDQKDLPEGGWGWLIIHEIAEDLMYKRIGSENHLSFVLSDNRAFKNTQ